MTTTLSPASVPFRVKQAAAARQEREIQRQMRFVERFRSKARKASQVQSRLKQLEKVQQIQLPRATRRVHYSFPEPPRGGGRKRSVLPNVSKSYGDHDVYRGLNLALMRGDRAALVGPNGAGKTTMLRILAGVLLFEEGERKTGHNVIHSLLCSACVGASQPWQHAHRGAPASCARGIGPEPPEHPRWVSIQRKRCPQAHICVIGWRKGAGRPGQAAGPTK